jgi:hypothetical protein
MLEALCHKPEGRGFDTPAGKRRKALGFALPLTKISTRSRQIMFLASRARPVRRAEDLTALCGPIVYTLDNVGSLISHSPVGLHGLLQG